MKQKKRKKGFNDLLLPIILVMSVLPFVVRLISYDTGLSDYSWYSDFDVVHDFFTYYKSCAFLLISFASFLIIIPYALLKKSLLKDMRAFLFLGIYAFFAVLSTILSVNLKSSLIGGFEHFESIFVLLGYLILLLYTYQLDKKEEDYRSILKTFLVALILMGIIGLLQMLGMDLLNYPWIQRLIIPHTDWAAYIGNMKSYLSNHAVSLTLYNPNYASVFLAMVIPFLIALLLPETKTGPRSNLPVLKKSERIIISLLTLLFFLLLYKTYSRTGLLALATALFVLTVFHHRLLSKRWRQCAIILACAVLLFIGMDSMNGFRFMNKINGTLESFGDDHDIPVLDKILTKEQGVMITMDGEEVLVSVSNSSSGEADLKFSDSEGTDITSSFDRESGKLHRNKYDNVSFRLQNEDGKDYMLCEINHITWKFYRDDKDGYGYINDFGKRDQLTKIQHIGLSGLEDIGSGRGYIWSRTIPLLKCTLITGTGPDTFPYVFPQTDYVGKANNCKTPVTLIEKPHSIYLMTGIQTGVVSLIALVVFYLLYLLQSIRIYRARPLSGLKERMGFGCFLATLSFVISGFFNDSSLQTTPLFVIMLGLGMDINFQMPNHGKSGID